MLKRKKIFYCLMGMWPMSQTSIIYGFTFSSGVDIAYRPIRSDKAQDVISRLPEWQKNADTVYLLRRKVIYIRSSAAIRCLLYLKWYYKLWYPILWLVPLPVGFSLRIISKNRHMIFQRTDTCSFRVD